MLPLQLWSASPVFISEFMASNGRTLADENGDFPDWIEIQNASFAPINLAGYFLTDDPARLAKWAFPSVELAPGGCLVVFASGKNRTADTNLPPRFHTNFQLDQNGGFLALVEPDGVTLADAFVAYPPQKADVAYGLAQTVVAWPLLSGSAPSLLVPANPDQLTPDWNVRGFVPGAGWTTETAPPALGFDTNQVSGAPANVAPSGAVAQSTVNGAYTANLAINGNLADFTHTLGTDTSPFWQVTLTNQTAIYSVILFNRTSCCGSRLRDITIEILSTNATGEVTNFRSVLLNPENAGYTYPAGPAAITNDLVALTGGPVLGQIIRVRRTPDGDLSGSGGQGNTDEAAVLSLGEVVVNASAASGLRPYFHIDLQARMWNQNASAFVRVPFTLTNSPNRLTLRVRYDDGFVAYLNGVEVARRNAPATPAWNAAATADRNLAGAITEETMDVSAGLAALVAGTNVLAVQVLNAAASNPDLLFQVELTASSLTLTPNAYLVDATPGALNNTDYYFGEVADTRFSVDRGYFTAPISLVITSDTPGALIYYSYDGSEPGYGKGTLYTGPLTLTNTTIVRARAFKDGLKPTAIDTHTYLFLDDVVNQAPTGQAPPYFPASWGRNRVDYGMDPTVIAKYPLAEWRDALTQIPSMSIVTEMKNLFDPATGIYANADGHGEDWERPASIELLDPTNAVPGRFQEPCGLRIRGGYSRDPGFVKHSLRVFFRRDYGAAQLHYPLFDNDGASDFDTFDLRTSQNYAWPRETDYNQGKHDTMVREVFCRETLGAMGQPYRRSRYYHLFLNGQYWGLYETDERPEASYGATYFGGNKEDYDVVKCGNHVANFVTEATDGNFTAWSNLWTMGLSMLTNAADSNYFRILGRNPDGSRNPALPVMVDVDNLIDYMLEIFYSGDGDATLSAFLGNVRPNNWFGLRNRNDPDMGFRFFNSDCEHTLGAPSSQVDRTGPFKDLAGSNVGNFIYSNPQYLHEELMLNAEYRLRFGDHVQKHFFNGGALTPEAGTNRFLRKAVQINKAIRAYEARWGDANTSRTRYTATDWTNMITTVITTWFPTRTSVVLQQLKTDALYPALSAPLFNQYGGAITNGFALSLSQTNGAGKIYYTLDGTDPRAVGGAISGNAVAYTNAFLLGASTRVKARVLSAGVWSALTQADFAVPGLLPLRITELMYHPAPLSAPELAAGFTNADDFEFIELRNVGPAAINLAGVNFDKGLTFTFTNVTLAAGERIVLVKNLAAFTFRYGSSARIGGEYAGNLNNAGERLRLRDTASQTIQDFTFADGWAPLTDGFGFSLVMVDDTLPASLWDQKSSWRASSALGGSPGLANPTPPVLPFVVVNELLTRPAAGGKVAVELANLGDSPANVSGWYLTDDFNAPRKFPLSTNTVIPAGGFVVFTEDAFNSPALGSNAFTFSPSGGEVRLFSAGSSGELTGYFHGWDFGAAEEDVSFGRHVTSTGGDQFVAQLTPTLGFPNAGPRVGPVVLSELMYHPPDIAGLDNTVDEFIEVFNLGGTAVSLFEPSQPSLTWQVTGGVGFVFPTNLTLPPGGSLLLVNLDPALDPAALTNFRALYGVPNDVPILGPYSGRLNNDTDDVELKKPTLFQTGFPGYVQVDKVSYHDTAPWPQGADGSGASLQRFHPGGYGNEPTNWTEALPSAGRGLPGGILPSFTVAPANQYVVAYQHATFSVQAAGDPPLRYQWRFNGANLPGATDSVLRLFSVQPSQAGDYSVLVFNPSGSALSSSATLTVGLPPVIVQQPLDVVTNGGSNATFTVVATGTGPLAYQWQFQGVNLPNATNATLVLTNLQLSNAGPYSVVVTDSVGPMASRAATLTVLVRPVITQQPQHLTLAVGQDGVLSVSAIGTLPMATRWLRNSGTYSSYAPMIGDTGFLVFSNTVLTNGATYRAVITNAAYLAPGTASGNAYVTVAQVPLAPSVAPGDTITLPAFVYGPAPIKLAWRFNGLNLPATTTTTATYSNVCPLILTNVQPAQAGTYTLWVTNAASQATPFAVQLRVGATGVAPAITQQPTNLVVEAGSAAAFTVVATGDAPLTYAWWFNDTNLLATATNAALQLTNVQAADVGAYKVVVSNPTGSATSTNAQLWLKGLDRDGDGLPDWQEVIANTDPLDPSSVLKLQILPGTLHDLTLQFQAMSNRAYTLLGFTNWPTPTPQVLTNLAPQPTNRTVQWSDQATNPPLRYYRLEVHPAQ